jgi:uncharacterized protein YciI
MVGGVEARFCVAGQKPAAGCQKLADAEPKLRNFSGHTKVALHCCTDRTMYAIAIIRYRKPLEDVLKHVDSHRAYLAGLKQEGLLIASGPLVPRNGGALLLKVGDDEAQATLDSIRDNDPFTRFGLAQYELWPWAPTIGVEELDRL